LLFIRKKIVSIYSYYANIVIYIFMLCRALQTLIMLEYPIVELQNWITTWMSIDWIILSTWMS